MGSPGFAAQGYRNNAVSGLSEEQMLNKGLHGLVVHLNRAKTVAVDDDGGSAVRRAQCLSDADRLLTFMLGLAAAETELGTTLVRCYTGIQQLIASALADASAESDQALDDAIDQARALERAFSERVGGGRHGQSR